MSYSDEASDNECYSDESSLSSADIGVIVGGIIGGLILCFMMCCCCLILRSRRKSKKARAAAAASMPSEQPAVAPANGMHNLSRSI